MSGPADRLLKLMYEWMEKAKECSSNLRDLARELESLRDDCNTVETVGNTVAVAGSVMSLLAAPFTGGASLVLAGALAGGVGASVSIGTKITELLMSSSKLKRVKEIDEQCKEITNKMQVLFEELRKQCPSSSVEEKDKHAVKEFLKAMCRHSGLDIHLKDLDDFIRAIIDAVVVNPVNKSLHFLHRLISEVLGVLSMFCLKPEGGLLLAAGALVIGTTALKSAAKSAAYKLEEKALSTVISTGAKQAGKSAAKSAAVKGVQFLGAAVGLALSLPEAIDSWKEAVKNKHETEASKSLRETADQINKAIQNLSDKLNVIRNALKKSIEIHHQKASKQRSTSLPSQQWFTSLLLVILSFFVLLCCFLFYPKTVTYSVNNPSSLTCGDNSCDWAYFLFVPLHNHDKGRGSQSSRDSESKYQAELEENVKKIKRSNNRDNIQLNMALVNTRSAKKFITRKDSTLMELCKNNSLDVASLIEAWFNEESPTTDEVNQWIVPPDYTMFNYTRTSGRGGGVAVIVKNDLNPEKIHFMSTSTFEYVAVTVTLRGSNEKAVIVNIYRTGGTVKNFTENFRSEFKELLLDVFNRFNKVLILGDFNIWFNRPEDDKRVAVFEKMIREHNLIQHVSQPTRGNNTLDLVLSNVNITVDSVQDNDFSDHRTVFFTATFNN